MNRTIIRGAVANSGQLPSGWLRLILKVCWHNPHSIKTNSDSTYLNQGDGQLCIHYFFLELLMKLSYTTWSKGQATPFTGMKEKFPRFICLEKEDSICFFNLLMPALTWNMYWYRSSFKRYWHNNFFFVFFITLNTTPEARILGILLTADSIQSGCRQDQVKVRT